MPFWSISIIMVTKRVSNITRKHHIHTQHWCDKLRPLLMSLLRDGLPAALWAQRGAERSDAGRQRHTHQQQRAPEVTHAALHRRECPHSTGNPFLLVSFSFGQVAKYCSSTLGSGLKTRRMQSTCRHQDASPLPTPYCYVTNMSSEALWIKASDNYSLLRMVKKAALEGSGIKRQNNFNSSSTDVVCFFIPNADVWWDHRSAPRVPELHLLSDYC